MFTKLCRRPTIDTQWKVLGGLRDSRRFGIRLIRQIVVLLSCHQETLEAGESMRG